ncbi:hypothetical protein OG783_33035 [Streptomyces jietaisiensis]|uniref:hypothetical protein n=1 Tax=Streptomyces griseoaurantiacus TaxID=68213 RepID=UPI00325434D0
MKEVYCYPNGNSRHCEYFTFIDPEFAKHVGKPYDVTRAYSSIVEGHPQLTELTAAAGVAGIAIVNPAATAAATEILLSNP